MNDRVMRVQDLSVHFKLREGGLLSSTTHTIKAVDGVSFDLDAGETLGIVGESGCGKSTLARALLALVKPGRGRVLWLGEDLNKLDEESLRKKRQDMQIVFQDPLAALNPRMPVRDIIAEPLWTFYPKMALIVIGGLAVLYYTVFDRPWALKPDEEPPAFSK